MEAQKKRIISSIMIWVLMERFQRSRIRRRILLQVMLQREQHKKRQYRYRSISYVLQNWSLQNSGWRDTECREYLRFTKAEIAQLISHFELDSDTFTDIFEKCGISSNRGASIMHVIVSICVANTLEGYDAYIWPFKKLHLSSSE